MKLKKIETANRYSCNRSKICMPLGFPNHPLSNHYIRLCMLIKLFTQYLLGGHFCFLCYWKSIFLWTKTQGYIISLRLFIYEQIHTEFPPFSFPFCRMQRSFNISVFFTMFTLKCVTVRHARDRRVIIAKESFIIIQLSVISRHLAVYRLQVLVQKKTLKGHLTGLIGCVMTSVIFSQIWCWPTTSLRYLTKFFWWHIH